MSIYHNGQFKGQKSKAKMGTFIYASHAVSLVEHT